MDKSARSFVPPPPLTPRQLQVLLNACAEHRFPERDRVMVLLSHAAGLRPSEIAAARRAWVLEDGLVGDTLRVAGRWAREVSMPRTLRNAILAYFRVCPGAAGDPLILSERMEFDDGGARKCLRASSVQYWFWKLSVETGIVVAAKSGRQGFIVRQGRALRDAAANVGDLGALVGLKRVEHYLDADAAAQRRLAETLERGLFGEEGLPVSGTKERGRRGRAASGRP